MRLKRVIHETLMCYARKEEWEKLGDYNQLLNGLVLAVSNELRKDFSSIHKHAARDLGMLKP